MIFKKYAFFCSPLVFILSLSSASYFYYLWPLTLPRCSRNDPNLDYCLLKTTREVLPKLARGFPEIGLGSLDPLSNGQFYLHSERWPVNLRVDLNDVSIIGPSKLNIHRVRYEKSSSTLSVEGFNDVVRLVGNYRVRGNVLVFPLNSEGVFDFEILGLYSNHTTMISRDVRDGRHGHVNFKAISVKLIRVDLKDPSLSYGANRAINRIVNDNWRILSRALTPSMELMIHNAYTAALEPLFSKFTLDDILPEDPIEEEEKDEGETNHIIYNTYNVHSMASNGWHYVPQWEW